jgi:hypothetical protein
MTEKIITKTKELRSTLLKAEHFDGLRAVETNNNAGRTRNTFEGRVL